MSNEVCPKRQRIPADPASRKWDVSLIDGMTGPIRDAAEVYLFSLSTQNKSARTVETYVWAIRRFGL